MRQDAIGSDETIPVEWDFVTVSSTVALALGAVCGDVAGGAWFLECFFVFGFAKLPIAVPGFALWSVGAALSAFFSEVCGPVVDRCWGGCHALLADVGGVDVAVFGAQTRCVHARAWRLDGTGARGPSSADFPGASAVVFLRSAQGVGGGWTELLPGFVFRCVTPFALKVGLCLAALTAYLVDKTCAVLLDMLALGVDTSVRRAIEAVVRASIVYMRF